MAAACLGACSWQPCLSPSQIRAPWTHAVVQGIPAKTPTTHTKGLSIPRAPRGRGCPWCRGSQSCGGTRALNHPSTGPVSLWGGDPLPVPFQMHVSESNVMLVSFFPLPSDNSFWDVIHTTTTKQPKTTRAPRKPNPGEHELPSPPGFVPALLPAQPKASGCAVMATLPLAQYFQPLVCLFT